MGFARPNHPEQTAIRNRTGYYYKGVEITTDKNPFPGVNPNEKQPHHATNWHPDSKKVEAAALWAALRDFNEVHKLTGVNLFLLKKWAVEPWWSNVVSQVTKEANELLDAKITEVLTKAVELMKDRIENGESIYDRRTKEYARIPLRAKDAAIVTDVLFNKRQLIRGEATSRSEAVDETRKIESLKKKFEELANQSGRSLTIEGEFHELSEGTGEGQAQPVPQNSVSPNERPSVGEDGVRGAERPQLREEDGSGESVRWGSVEGGPVSAEQISETETNHGSSGT